MSESLLTEELIARIDKFNLKAKLIVEGFMIGLHKSPYHGFSVEFSDHRQYNPGDNVKSIDWKVYAKTNRYYIKRFEDETNLKCYLVIDHSNSMDFSSQNINKMEYAKSMASALAYLMINQQDAVGLLTYTDQITNFLPAKVSKSYLNLLLKEIYHLKAKDQTRTAEILHGLADKVKKRGLIIIISDLLDNPEDILSGLMHFRHQKHEVILFHLQDVQEEEFDYKRDTEFIDSETGEKILVSPWQIRSSYLEEYQKSINYLKQKCFEAKIDYNPITTNTPFDEILMRYLNKRARLA